MNLKNIIFTLVSLSIIFTFFNFDLAFAEENNEQKPVFNDNISLKDINFIEGKDSKTRPDIQEILKRVIDYFTVAMSTLAVLSIIIGGFMYVGSAGNDDQVTKAKQFIYYPIIGLIIIACAYIIVRLSVGFLY